MSYFDDNVIQDIFRERFISSPYNDIINSCKAEIVNHCQDPNFSILGGFSPGERK